MRQLFIIFAGLLASAVLDAADLRVSASEALKSAVHKPQPVYSAVARQVKVAGRVEVEALVGEDGTVQSVKAVTGNPLLTASAVSAVEKWKFTPFTADGKPVRAICTLSFDFRP